MVEISRPWGGIVTGDAGPYSDDVWTDIWKGAAPIIATQGVFRNQLNDLDLSGLPISPVSVNSGRGVVNGIWYESNASVSLAVPTPAANPRVDRIVLRADWVLQTVRLTVVQGAEAAAPVPPALVQVDGTTWDLPLWQVHTTVGGVITFHADERDFIGQYEPSSPTDELVYIEDEFYWPELLTAATGLFRPWGVVIAGNYTLSAMTAFGPGAVTLSVSGVALGGVALRSISHRPDLIDAHVIVRTKNPNTDANLDRIIGYVSVLANPIPANGVFFRSVGAGNWFGVCRAAGVETVVDTGIAPDDVWRKFEFRQHAQDTVIFTVDDVQINPAVQATIPAASLDLVPGQIMDSGVAAVVQDYMQIDRIRMTGDR